GARFMHKDLRGAHESNAATKLPVFSDPTRARQRRVKVFSTATLLALSIWSVAVGVRIVNAEKFLIPIPVLATQSAQPLFGSDVASVRNDEPAQSAADDGSVLAPNLSAVPICRGPRGRAEA